MNVQDHHGGMIIMAGLFKVEKMRKQLQYIG